MFTVFEWRGEPIPDIKKFCKEHDYDLVRVRVKEQTKSSMGYIITIRDEIEDWPAPFYDNLRLDYSGGDFTTVKEIHRTKAKNL